MSPCVFGTLAVAAAWTMAALVFATRGESRAKLLAQNASASATIAALQHKVEVLVRRHAAQSTSTRARGSSRSCDVPCPASCGPPLSLSCARAVRPHKTFAGTTIYSCDDIFFFTHPPPTAKALYDFYQRSLRHAQWGAVDLGPPGDTPKAVQTPRSTEQHRYFMRHNLPLSNSKTALVVEVGCNNAQLLSNFAAPKRTLICFEPAKTSNAERVLHASGAGHVVVIHHSWTRLSWAEARAHLESPHQTIDLFISSHVIEHMADLCGWAHDLYALMSPGGAVLTELPTHTLDYVTHSRSYVFGLAHLSFPTPRGFLAIMEAAGFVLGDLSTYRNVTEVGANGRWMRSVFLKPRIEGGAAGPGGSEPQIRVPVRCKNGTKQQRYLGIDGLQDKCGV